MKKLLYLRLLNRVSYTYSRLLHMSSNKRNMENSRQSCVKKPRLEFREMKEEPALETTAQQVYIDVVSSGTSQMEPCLVIRSPGKSYLINVPEGCSKYSKSLQIREKGIHDMLITRAIYKNIGGITGFLLNKYELGRNKVEAPTATRIHGPPNITKWVNVLREYVDSDHDRPDLNFLVQEKAYMEKKYDDDVFRIYYIPVKELSTDKSDAHLGMNIEPISSVDVSFLFELKKSVRKMSINKVMQLGIKRGPLLTKLKSGESITLDDGREIHPDDVLEVDNSIFERPNLLVVDCSSLSKFSSLNSSSVLEPYTNGSKQLSYVVHFTPASVLEAEEYQSWMRSFGSDCQHLVINGTGPQLPLIDTFYVDRFVQHKACPEIFPEIYPKDHTTPILQTTEMPKVGENVYLGIPLSRLIMREKMRIQMNRDDKVEYDGAPKIDIMDIINRTKIDIFSDQEFIDKLAEFRTFAHELQNASVQEYPKLTFLGTVSAVPSKHRNVSSYVLETNENTALMIDCGEGTYGQLWTVYGDEAPRFLTKLNAIFITHAHQDHFWGLSTLITKRRESFEKLGVPYRPLILVANRIVMRNYRSSFVFENHENLVHVIDCTFFKRQIILYPGPESKEKRMVTFEDNKDIIECTQYFSRAIFSPHEWNLKRVSAVQVEHSMVNCCGFIFEDLNGHKLVFSGDTLPCERLVRYGKDADVLIHEATFEDVFELDAYKKKHSTVSQAIEIGKRANVKYTILSHFSSRYAKAPPIPENPIPENVGFAYDFMVVKYGHLPLVPKLVPLLKIIHAEELGEQYKIHEKTRIKTHREQRPRLFTDLISDQEIKE